MTNLYPIIVPHDVDSQAVKVGSLAISAGFPSPAGDDLEDEIDPIAWVVRRPGSSYWYKIEGDCLSDEGIHDGDLVCFDRSGKKRLGRVVLAIVDGAFTTKRLAKRDGQYWLDSANARQNYKPILCTEDTEFCGVLAGVVRRCDIE